MPLAQQVVQFLRSQQIPFQVVETKPFSTLIQAAHRIQVDPVNCVQSVLLQDRFGLVLCALPSTYVIDFNALKELFKRNFIRVDHEQVKRALGDCLVDLVPPLGDAFGTRMMVDESVLENESVLFPLGDDTHLIKMKTADFQSAAIKAWFGGRFAHPVEIEQMSMAAQLDLNAPALDIKSQIESMRELPPLPKTAQHILQLSHKPNASVKELAEVVETDPSLAAQVVRYANSPFFYYRGNVFSVQDAIARVLGFDNVMNLALGIATARPFRVNKQGPLGLHAFWRNATYSAAVAQAISKIMPADRRPNPGLAYLSGLLHNFGYLILGHYFSKAFFLLNKLVESEPEADIMELEIRSLGVHHGDIGAWTFEAWDMPAALVQVARYHHDEHYRGDHDHLVHLVLITDRLLSDLGFGTHTDGELPDASLKKLGVSESQVVEKMNKVLEGCDGLNTMARQLVA